MNGGADARWAHHGEGAVAGLDTIERPGQAAAMGGIGAAHPVVADLSHQGPAIDDDLNPDEPIATFTSAPRP